LTYRRKDQRRWDVLGEARLVLSYRYLRGYEAKWSAFIDAVRRGSRAAVTLANGVLALACAEAAAGSAQSGKAEAHAGNLVGT